MEKQTRKGQRRGRPPQTRSARESRGPQDGSLGPIRAVVAEAGCQPRQEPRVGWRRQCPIQDGGEGTWLLARLHAQPGPTSHRPTARACPSFAASPVKGVDAQALLLWAGVCVAVPGGHEATWGPCLGQACLREGVGCSVRRAAWLQRSGGGTGEAPSSIHLLIYSTRFCQALGRFQALFQVLGYSRK